MPWAVFFLPSHIIELTNFSTSVELYTGSGKTSRTTALLLRGIGYLRFRPLGSVFRSSLAAVGYACGIQRAADHVIAHAGKVLHTAPADQHDRVLLQVVADARDVRGHFDSISKPHAGDFPQRRIRLLGSGGVYAGAHPALLRTAIERRARSLPAWRLPPSSHKLVKRRHEFPLVEQTHRYLTVVRVGLPLV